MKFQEATEEIRQAWDDTFCRGECDYSPCKEYGSCNEEGCFEFHQEYYPEEFEEMIEEDNLVLYRRTDK